MGAPPVDPIFFPSPEAFRAWLEANHASAQELWLGFWKRATGRPSPTWSESVDQALCYGWIDGVRCSLGDESYAIRFTPRRPESAWSAVNLRKMESLIAGGLMRPAGMAVYEARDPAKTNLYSFEREEPTLTEEEERELRANEKAWAYFQAQAPSFRRGILHWLAAAKQPATRVRRFQQLVQFSEAGQPVPPMRVGRPRES